MWRQGLVLALALVALPRRASATPADLTLDGGFLVGRPAALPTGLASGVGVGAQAAGPLAFGLRLGWTSATEYSTSWTVTHSDIRMRATGALQREVGRGTLALRLGLGGTLVHETRERDQAARAGLTGADAEQSATSLLPAADLEGVVTLRLVGELGLAVGGGPSLHLQDGHLRTGFVALVGLAWLP